MIFLTIVSAMTGKKFFTFVYTPEEPRQDNTHIFPTEAALYRVNKKQTQLRALVPKADPNMNFHEDCRKAAATSCKEDPTICLVKQEPNARR